MALMTLRLNNLRQWFGKTTIEVLKTVKSFTMIINILKRQIHCKNKNVINPLCSDKVQVILLSYAEEISHQKKIRRNPLWHTYRKTYETNARSTQKSLIVFSRIGKSNFKIMVIDRSVIEWKSEVKCLDINQDNNSMKKLKEVDRANGMPNLYMDVNQ